MNNDKPQTDRQRRVAERRRLLASGPASPCIGVCKMDEQTGFCLGCTRTIDEIRNWSIMLPEQRHETLHQITERKKERS